LSDDHSVEETSKGIFDLKKAGKKIGRIVTESYSIPKYKDVAMSVIKLGRRGKGLSKELYREVATILESRGQVLVSSGFRTDDANRVWESLVKDGYAEEIGKNKANGSPVYAMLPDDPFGSVQKDDQIPEKTKNRITKLADRLKNKFNKDTDPSIILEDVLANLQRLDTWYETANDTQRENAVRFARKYLGFKEIRTPKIVDYRGRIRKIFSLITDVTKIDLEQQIEIARELKKRDKLTKKEKKILDDSLNEILKELEGEGKLTTSQVKAVIRKFQKIDVFSPSQVDSFVDYMTKVFADADYMAKIKRAESKLPKARNNIKTKTGINEVGPVLYKLFRINPRLIPSQFFETYLDLVNTFSENKKELNPKNLEKTMEDGQAILNYLNVEATKLDWLSKGFNDYVAENKIKNKGFKEIVGLMKKEGIIDDTDQEIMLKYQSVIDPSKRPKKTEQEIQEEKDELVKDIKDLSKEKNPMFSTNDEKLLAEKLKNQIKGKSIDQLSLNELKTLLQVISNINQGLITNNALQLSIKLDSIQDSKSPTKSLMGVSIGILTKAYNKVKASISDKNYIQKTLESSPLYYLDMVLGDGKSTVLYDSLFRKLATAEQRFNYDMRKIRIKIEKAQNNVKKSLKGSQNALIKSSAKQYLYMLELEYLSNADKTKVKKASQYLEKTIDEGKLANRDIEMLEDIRNEFVVDGDVDMKKLFDSFNKAERESIKVSQEINSSLSDKAMYTAGVIRGQRIDLLNNYVHHIVTSDKFDGKTIDDGHEFMQKFNNSLKPSTKAKTLVERQNVVTALNFDIYNSVNRGSKLTLLDYHLSVPIKTARMTMRQVKANLEEEGVYKNKKEIYEGINSYLENTIETFIFNNISSIGGPEMLLATIAKIGYQRALVSTARMTNELLSNFSYLLNYGIKDWSRGMRHRNVDQEVIAEAMSNLGSLALGKLYSDAGMRSRFAEKITTDNPGVKGKKNKSKVRDVLGVINYYTLNRGIKAVDAIAETIIPFSDQMMTRPLWNGAFDAAFEKETGQKFPEDGFERIAANDQAFMSEYKDALKVATRKADDVAIEAGASSGMFTGITRGKDWKTNKNVLSGGIKFLFSNFNHYMTTFMSYEYMSFRKGLNAAMGDGTITRKEGVQLMAAVTTRMTLYTWLGSLITKGVVAYLLEALGLREEEPEDKEGKDTKFLRSFVQTGLSLFVGRNFGNMTKGVQNLIIEDINEKYLDILRDGEYDKYKNSLAYTISPSKKPYETTQLQDYITPFAGPFGKLINSANAAIRVFEEKGKKEKDAKERQRKRKYKLFFSDIPAAIGLLPLSKEVEKEFNNWIYNDLKYESKQKKKEKKSGEETYPKAFNISDLKEVAPELYEELKAIEDETKAIEKEIKDDLKSD
jgi:hypothetical protein